MTTLTDTQVITASGGLVELGYSQITSNVSVPVTAATSPTTVISDMTVVCDGGPVLVEFFAPIARPGTAAGNIIYINLYQDGAELDRGFAYVETPVAGSSWHPVHLARRVTPTAGSHTFSIRAYAIGNAGQINAGSGGTGFSPAFLRVSKIVQATQWPAVTTGTIICTSSTRPASPFVGQSIYETDTSLAYTYNGSAWVQTGDSTGAWTAFTPTISQSSTVTYSGPMRYTRIGRTIHANCALYITGSGSAGTGVTVSLPVAAQASLPVIGSSWIYDASAGVRYVCAVDLASTTSVSFLHDASGAASWGQNPSIGLANADQIRFGITYEAAS